MCGGMTLAQTQRDFCAFIVGDSPEIELAVAENARRGLAVYHHAFRANLIACLADTFEKTAAWLGDEAFETAALEHIGGHPPSSWTLADFGEGFDRTLASLYPDDPEVEELAWLDWSLRRAFDGPDCEPRDPASLAEIDWEKAILRLAPTLVLRPVTTNVATLWSAMAEGETPPAVSALDGFCGLVVWRHDLTARFQSLPESEFRALEGARSGVSFGELCAELASGFQNPDDVVTHVGVLLARWFAEQMVIGADQG
jgi:hypothetical protein